jgi:sugar lactone lactonase YvrE
MKIDVVAGVEHGIGEGPLWDVAQQALYSIDVMAKQIVRLEPQTGEVQRWDLPSIVGSMAICSNGDALVALATGIHRFDFASGAATLVVDPEPNEPRTVLTEGKVDPAGRFWVTSFDLSMQAALGNVYRLDTDGTLHQIDQGYGVPNGTCWNPQGTIFYLSDSHAGKIFAYSYDKASGAISDRAVFADTSELGGIPDGATVDSQGNYWVAICGGGKVACFTPDGRLSRTIVTPTQFPSSVMFGGADLNQLYVTSINPAVTGRGVDPQGGRLIVISDLDVQGLPETRYGG